ncbi:hypothetical protein B296_00030850 [Ensete ventricosum]|uniref:Uncharacterized protein n=1 Tax=Ensete ventricosum TaxID=4639 RepID=A0A426ZCW0_ENSVE|nr:hypothetical protein B296_00030850 [Ensete ventricosum]
MVCRSCEGSEGDDIEAVPLAGGVLRQKRRRSRPLRAPRQRGSWKALGAPTRRSNWKPNKKVTSPSLFFSFDLGLEALMDHFRHSRFACHDDEYMPVVFSPPRDGRQLTDPVLVAGGREATARGNNLADGGSVAPAEVDGCAASSTTAST